MTAEQFAYWLQEKAELHPEQPTQEQWDCIKEHLSLVFKKVTPPLNLSDLIRSDKISRQLTRQEVLGEPKMPEITC